MTDRTSFAKVTPLHPKPQIAPKHLNSSTREWFDNVCATYRLEPHHLKLLTRAGEAWDRGEQARIAIAKHGLTYVDRFGAPHARPEVGIERDAMIVFSRLVRELDLDVDATPAPSRPPSIRSNRGA